MAATILTLPADMEQVRKALDASLTADELPDSTIQLAFYLDVGEAMVIEKVPGYAGLTGAAPIYFKAAVVAQVAALLAPAMPGILPKTEEAMTYKVTREPVDWERKAASLQELANANLGRASGRTGTAPSIMSVSGPTRKASVTG